VQDDSICRLEEAEQDKPSKKMKGKEPRKYNPTDVNGEKSARDETAQSQRSSEKKDKRIKEL